MNVVGNEGAQVSPLGVGAPAAKDRMPVVHATWDLHCHCLHGLDDGPATLEESVALCRALVADGIRTVVATPHQFGRYENANPGNLIRRKVAALQGVLDDRDIELRVLPGADVRVDERVLSGLVDGSVVSIGDGKQAVLLEIPHTTFIDPLGLIQMLRERGIVGVVTHPERQPQFARDPERYAKRWTEVGGILQVTAGSVTGEFGATAERIAWQLLTIFTRNVFVASDAHDTVRRPPRMAQATQLIERKLGTAAAKHVVETLPRLLLGNVLPENAQRRMARRREAAREPRREVTR